MTVKLRYETPDGVRTLEREEIETEIDGLVSVYDNPENKAGLQNVVWISTNRVIDVVFPDE